MAKLTTQEIKDIKELLDEIKTNSNFQIRDSEYYEPWDMSASAFEDIADSCYYRLCNCMDLLKRLMESEDEED